MLGFENLRLAFYCGCWEEGKVNAADRAGRAGRTGRAKKEAKRGKDNLYGND